MMYKIPQLPPPQRSIRHSVALILLIMLALPLSPGYAATDTNISTTIRVRTAKVDTTPVGATHIATGIVAAFRKATVAAEVSGRIVERLVEPGTLAKTGQVLVRIDPERATLDLRQNQAMARASRVEADHAKHEYQRGLRLFQKKVISQDTVDDLRFAERGARAQLNAAEVRVATAQRNLDDTSVAAPFAGQIENVHVQVGDLANPGQPLITLTDFSQARVIAGVTSRETNAIQSGEPADVVFDDLGGRQIRAKVTSVGRVKDASNGTYPVELLITDRNATEALREGMIATINWRTENITGAQRMSIPSAALVKRRGEIHVYTVNNSKAELRKVRIGASDGRRVEILAGVSEGELVVIDGQFALTDGASVVSSSTKQN